MKRITALAATVSVFTAALAGCGNAQKSRSQTVGNTAPDSEVQPKGDGDLVTFDGLIDATRIGPGQEFLLLARFRVAPDWYIHWQNPGEQGLPTEVEITAPAGFELSALRYPGPTRIESADGIVSYGYRGDVVISAIVIAPDELDDRSFEFDMTARWLACRAECVQKEASATVEVEVATPGSPSRPLHADLVRHHEQSLPVPLDELPGVDTEWREQGEQLTLVITVAGAERKPIYFPSRIEQLRYTGQLAVPRDGESALHLSYKKDELPLRARGVLATGEGKERRYYQVDSRQ